MKNVSSLNKSDGLPLIGVVIATFGHQLLVELKKADLLQYLNGLKNPEDLKNFEDLNNLENLNALNDLDETIVFEAVNKGRQLNTAVGDVVRLSQASANQMRIEEIMPRKNYLHRSDGVKSKAFAANLDHLIWVVAPEPSFHAELLDRAIIAATAIDLPVHIVLNKADLGEEVMHKMHQDLRVYQGLGVSITMLANNQAAQVHAFFAQFAGQRLLLLGQSGVGKSTLLNTLSPDLHLKTREISTVLNTGKHTTTHSRLYRIILNNVNNLESLESLEIIDSPGFQLFGLSHLSFEQIIDGFSEFATYLGQCRFHNCKHISEPNCAILAAVKNNKNDLETISQKRYQSYCTLVQSLFLQKKRF